MAQPRTAGPAPGYVRNPGHRITLEPSPRRVRVLFNGETVADSTRMKMMHESHHLPVYYFPLEGASNSSGSNSENEKGQFHLSQATLIEWL